MWPTSAAAALLLACAAEDAEPGGADEARAPTAEVAIADRHNYRFSGTLDGPSFPLAEGRDVALDWSALYTDLQCHDLDPVADIDNTALLAFPLLGEEEVEQGLSLDSLEQVDLGVYLSYAPGDETRASLSQFTFFGTDADIEQEFLEGSGTWLVLLTTGTTLGVGARMIAFLEPRADTTALEGAVDDGCPVLDLDVDLHALEPLDVLARGPWQLDWSALGSTGQGSPFDPLKVDGLMVAWFTDLGLDDLEADFLDLEQLAQGLWTMDHPSGTTADLAGLVDAQGDAFPGFVEDGTWLLALRCGTCPNPAPLFLTVVAPWAD